MLNLFLKTFFSQCNLKTGRTREGRAFSQSFIIPCRSGALHFLLFTRHISSRNINNNNLIAKESYRFCLFIEKPLGHSSNKHFVDRNSTAVSETKLSVGGPFISCSCWMKVIHYYC